MVVVSVPQCNNLSRADATEAQAQLDTARANLSAADASLDRAEESGDDASIATAEAQVTEAKAAVTEAERTVAGTVLRAPMAGTVTAVNGSIGASSAGSSGATGADGGGSTGFMELANLARMQVSANFAEADATHQAEGGPGGHRHLGGAFRRDRPGHGGQHRPDRDDQ
jgi:macrolide-specific efflux system membrane fusion protein